MNITFVLGIVVAVVVIQLAVTVVMMLKIKKLHEVDDLWRALQKQEEDLERLIMDSKNDLVRLIEDGEKQSVVLQDEIWRGMEEHSTKSLAEAKSYTDSRIDKLNSK